jgi:hypothetical protein
VAPQHERAQQRHRVDAVKKGSDRIARAARGQDAAPGRRANGESSQMKVLIASVACLFADLVWGPIVAVGSEPCGIYGNGILQATLDCPVQAIHVATALLGALVFGALLIAAAGGFAYA